MAVFTTGGTPNDSYDENTLFLLHGNSIEDKSMRGCSIANTGVVLSSEQTKLNSGSLYFDGNAQLAIPLNELGLDFNGDWTFEFFHYTTQTISSSSAFFCLNQASHGFIIGSPTGGKERIFAGNSGWTFIPVTSMGNVKNGAWVHRAICKEGSALYFFENGALFGTATTTGTLTPTAAELLIGYRATTSYKGGYVGYFDEVRISNVARWTSDFTPPTAAYKG